MEFLIGIVCGLALSMFFSFGPAFFSLIQNSIHYGFRKSVGFAFGVSLSDVMVVFLMLTVLRNVNMDAALHNVYVATVGSVVIAVMGVLTFRRRSVPHREQRADCAGKGDVRFWQLFLHGFALNFLNPLIWIYWVSLITVLSAEVGLSQSERYVFFAGLLMAVLGADILKCRLASLMQTLFNARFLNIFNKVTGSILIGFAVYLLVSMILYQTSPSIREKEQESSVQSIRMIQTLHNHAGKDSTRGGGDTLYLE